jgi:hypothetical protein
MFDGEGPLPIFADICIVCLHTVCTVCTHLYREIIWLLTFTFYLLPFICTLHHATTLKTLTIAAGSSFSREVLVMMMVRFSQRAVHTFVP